MSYKIQSRLVALTIEATDRERDKKHAKAHDEQKKIRIALENQIKADAIEAEELKRRETEELERQLGPPEVASKFGGDKSQSIHLSHNISSSRGVTWCNTCGCYGTGRGRNLLKECEGRATKAGEAALSRIRKGLTPHSSVRWQE